MSQESEFILSALQLKKTKIGKDAVMALKSLLTAWSLETVKPEPTKTDEEYFSDVEDMVIQISGDYDYVNQLIQDATDGQELQPVAPPEEP